MSTISNTIRQVIGYNTPPSGGGGGGGVTIHGALAGLTADDHLQYLLTNGGRVLTGDLQMGGFGIVGLSNVITTGTQTSIVGSTTNSTSISSGSLIVNGGAAVQKSLYVGLQEFIKSTIESSSISTGALIIDGGAGIAKNLYVGSNLGVGSSSSFAGNLSVTSGTVTTASHVAVGGNLVVTATTNLLSNLSVAGVSVLTGTVTTGSNLAVGGNLGVTSSALFNHNVSVAGTTLAVSFDITAGRNLNITSSSVIGGNLSLPAGSVNAANDLTAGRNLSITSSSVFNGNISVNQTTTFNGNVIFSATSATITIQSTANSGVAMSTGALIVNGGVSIQKYINGAGARGDIIAGNGTNMSALTPGSNGTVLIADSTQTNGVRWGTVGGSGPTVVLTGVATTAIDSRTTGTLFFIITPAVPTAPSACAVLSKNTATNATYYNLAMLSAVPGGLGTTLVFTWPASSGVLLNKSDTNDDGSYTVTVLP